MVSYTSIEITRVRTERITAYLWIMFIICFVGNIMGGIASTIMPVYLPEVVRELLGAVSDEKISQASSFITSFFFVGWAIGGFLWGYIGDHMGRARSLALSIGMFGLATILSGLAGSWHTVMILRFFCGFGVGGMLVINTTLLSEDWPEHSRAIFIGILSIGFPVGIFSSGVINYIIPDWHKGFMIGLIPLFLSVVAFLYLKESEKWSHSFKKEIKPQTLFLEHRNDLINGSIIFGCMLIGLWAIFSWLPTWVQSILKDSDGQRERSLSMMLLGAGGLSGGFVSGWVSNAIGTRKALLLCFLACFSLAFILFKTNLEFTSVTLIEIGILSFFFGISQGVLSVYIPLLFPVLIRATATGFCFNLGRFFTAAAVFFVGSLITLLGGYGNSLFIFSFVFLLGFIILFFRKLN
jgi:predicted MFS family arabinose efflux permease